MIVSVIRKFIKKIKRKILTVYNKLPHIKWSREVAEIVYRLDKRGVDHGMSLHELAYYFCRDSHVLYLYPFLSYRTIHNELDRLYEIEQYM